ncbi:MAG: DMT family transporter [Oscillospiraceae bacterium]
MLVAAALMCSIGGVCVRMISWQPLAINGARGLIAACVTAAFMAFTHHKLRINRQIISCAVALALTMYLYVLSLKLTTAANAILLMYTSPVFVMLYMWIFLHIRPTAQSVISVVTVLCGMMLLLADGMARGNIYGDILGVLSGCAYAGVFLVNTGKDGDAFSSYFLGQLLAGLIGMPFVFAVTDWQSGTLICIALLGVFQLGISYILMAKGIMHTPPFTASLITSIEPVLSPIWVMLFCGESMSKISIFGGALVICSIIYGSKPHKKIENEI